MKEHKAEFWWISIPNGFCVSIL